MLEQRTDLTDRALARRIDRYASREVFGAWLASHTDGLQLVEDDVWAVILGRLIDNAEGVQLDILGRLVGEPRWTSNDDEQRIGVRARIACNISQGLWTDIYQVARLVLRTADEDATFTIREYFPCTVIVDLLEPMVNDPNRAVRYLQQARSAGVNLQLVYPLQPIDECFTWGGTSLGEGKGWSYDGSTGGLWVSVTK